jgi:signal transduction histidine kinase
VVRNPVTTPSAQPFQAPASGSGVAALERSDLAAINHWLSVTRLRTGLIVACAIPLLRFFGGIDIPWLAITAICLVTAALSPLYERCLAREVDLRVLVYVQLIVDTLAITAGLGAMGPNGILFRYFYLMTIVPATMVSGTCAIAITVLSALCYGALLSVTPLGAIQDMTRAALFVVPVYIFSIVANQCFFYKQHVRDKNRHLAAAGERLQEANAELRVTAETALGLLEVGRALGTSLDLGVVMERLHAVAAERLRTEWCATLLVDPNSTGGYRLLASRGLGAASSMQINEALWDFGALIAAEKLVEVPDAAAAGPAQRAFQGWPIASGIFAAMRCGNRAIGIFATGYREQTGAFARFQRELAVGIATQAAVAIENASLHAKQREEAEISAALLRAAETLNANLDDEHHLDLLTALTCSLVGCDRITVLLYEPKAQTFRIAAGTDTAAPHQLDEARALEFDVNDFPFLAEANQKGWAERWEGDGTGFAREPWMRRWSLRSVAAVPLSLRGEIIGALTAGGRERSGPFAPKVRRLLTGIAYQTVAALENGRLLRNLRAANTLKSEFIGTMSHELRTPLNAIIGYNELLREGEFGAVADRQREVCTKVLDYSRQLLELIEATLDVSRMESGALPVTLGPVHVGALLEDLASQIPASWVKPAVTLSFAADSHLPEIQSDYPKLKMVVRNLVHNALKFTDGGSVAVHAGLDADGSTLVVAVSDTGIGLTTESQAIIFDMFRQVDGSDRRRHDGVGLGLYIVRRLTAILGGTISLESELGRGSCFRLRFPIASAADARTPAPAPREALSA